MERIATDTNNNVESTGVMRNELRVFADIGVAQAWLRIIGGSLTFWGMKSQKKVYMDLSYRSISIKKKHLSVCLFVVCSVPAFCPAMRRWPAASDTNACARTCAIMMYDQLCRYLYARAMSCVLVGHASYGRV